nr:ribonuclease H-like domain-containing protein [Tanacetum cinerariifolium]
MIKVLPPKTAEEVVARERERKARTTLLMVLPEDHLAKFYKMADAKEMWKAIKSRFSGNDESKKMQKYFLKQQFKGFFVSVSEGLYKGYDGFQTLLSQLEIHGAGVSHEDVNQKFLRSLSSSWSQVALIMRTKPSINDVSTAYSVSSPSVLKLHKEGSSSYTDEVIHSFFANQSSAPQLDYNDLEQINDDDMEEMDLKWQVAIVSMRIKKFQKRTRRKLQFDTKDLVGFDKTKVKCFNCHKMGHFSRDCRAKGNQDSKRRDGGYNGNKARDNERRHAYQDDSKALVTIDGEDIDWSGHVEKDTRNYVIMAYSSSNSSSDNESVFMNKEYDLEDTPVNDRYVEGMHTSADESDSKPIKYASSEYDSNVETTTSMPAPIDKAPKIVCEPKVWTNAPIIEEYESDSNDDLVSNVQENRENPNFTFIDYVKHVKSHRENIKEKGTPYHIPKIKKHDRYGHTRKGLGYTRKSSFVCGSFSHLTRYCDFHEKRMAKQAELAKCKNKVTGQRDNKPVWNNVQRVNHQNKFVSSVVLTKTIKFPVNAARQNFSLQATSTSTTSKVNTARHFVNDTRPKIHFYKTHSPNKRPFHNKTAQRTTFSYHKVNTVNTSLSAIKGN